MDKKKICHRGHALTADQWLALGARHAYAYANGDNGDETWRGVVDFGGGFVGDQRQAVAITLLERSGGNICRALELLEERASRQAIGELAHSLAALVQRGASVDVDVTHRLASSPALRRVLDAAGKVAS